jgi:DNA-binding response OmpR family regulator
MKILLVEDDQITASFIIKGLKEVGYVISHAANGEDGLHMALNEAFDAAVIDIMLPRLDGLSLIKKIRREKVMTPVIVLSAKDSVDDRIKGLRSGGDDYMIKPFSLSELIVRVQSLIRRANAVSEPTSLTVGDLSLDLLSRKITRGGKEIELKPKEFSLLEYLMYNSGRIVSKEMIMEHVWDYSFDPGTNVVESQICRLRNKIDLPDDKKLIHTVKGIGYVLEDRK